MILVDASGREHAAAAVDPPPRIVSLVPSITELLCDLGLTPWLVGRTGFCIHPAATVAGIPKVGGTKDVNIDKIRTLAPTHVIVNIDENEKPTVDALAEFIPNVVVTHPQAPRDNLTLYRLLGGVFGAVEGVAAKAEVLCGAFEREYAAVLALPRQQPRTVLYCIWKDPWMTVSRSTYIAAMLDLIGWRHWRAISAQGEHDPARYPRFSWSIELIDGIDAVLLSSEPFRFTEAHVSALEKQIGKPVQLVDGEMLSWYGSRAIPGLQYLRELALSPG